MQKARFLASELSERDIQTVSKHILRFMICGLPPNISYAGLREMQSLLPGQVSACSEWFPRFSVQVQCPKYQVTYPFLLPDCESR